MILSDVLNLFSKNATGQDENAVDIIQLQNILARIYTLANNTRKNNTANLDNDLIDYLSILKVQLESYIAHHNHDKALNTIASALIPIVEQNIKAPTEHSGILALYEELQNLHIYLHSRKDKNKNNRSVWRNTIFISTLIPLLGLGLNYVNGQYLQAILVTNSHMAFPLNSYKFDNQKFTLKDTYLSPYLGQFQSYFFQDYVVQNPASSIPKKYDMPNTYVLKGKNTIKDNEEDLFHNKLTRHRIFGNQDQAITLNKVRLYFKNIKSNNIIDSITIKANKIAEIEFPWTQLDIQSHIETEIYEDKNRTPLYGLLVSPIIFDITVKKAPIKNLRLNVKASNNTQSWQISEQNFPGYVMKQETFSVSKNLSVFHTEPTSTVLFQISQHSQVDLSKGIKANDLSQADFNDKISSLGAMGIPQEYFIYFKCPDKSIVTYGSMQTLAPILAIESIDVLSIQASFDLVDGTNTEKDLEFSGKEDYWHKPANINAKLKTIEECILASGLIIPGSDSDYAVAGDRFEKSRFLHKAAEIMMEKSDIPKGKIIARYSMYMFATPQQDELTDSVDVSKIIHEGEYLVVELWAANFASGLYQFDLLVDDKLIDKIEMEVILPQHQRFEQELEYLFKKDALQIK
jgi:hypothetical protein